MLYLTIFATSNMVVMLMYISAQCGVYVRMLHLQNHTCGLIWRVDFVVNIIDYINETLHPTGY